MAGGCTKESSKIVLIINKFLEKKGAFYFKNKTDLLPNNRHSQDITN